MPIENRSRLIGLPKSKEGIVEGIRGEVKKK